MPTVIGLLFLVASLYLFLQKDDRLFALVLFSAIFQSSSVVVLNQAGVEPFYLVASMFVLQGIFQGKSGIYPTRRFKGKRWMIFFGVLAVTSAFTLPFVFAGTPVYEQHIGIDEGFFIRPPLHFTNANFTHSLSLLLGVLVVLGASQRIKGKNFSRRGYLATFYVLVGMIFVQFICALLGISFPYTLLQNHAGRVMQAVDPGDLASRFPGTFTESSGAGQLLAGFTTGFLAEHLKRGRSLLRVIIGVAAIVLVRSTGAIVALAVASLLLLLSQPVARWPFYINLTRLMRVGFLLLVAGALLAGILLSPLRSSIFDVTVNKQDTASFLNRTAADAYAIDLAIKTDGIGVGMGSNRPSSLITSLLSTVGVLGLLMFLITYFKLLWNASRSQLELPWAGVAFFLSMVASGPDYETPWLWVFLAFAVQIGLLMEERKHGMIVRTSPNLTGILQGNQSV